MAAKVALTAEEFRENSQRSIALFNTEKLSTNSTHVLKSAYAFCAFLPLQSARSVWRQRNASSDFCTVSSSCNLHGACGGKGSANDKPGYFAFAAICTERVEAKPMIVSLFIAFPIVICTERVETKRSHTHVFSPFGLLQSAQSMWGQRGMASLLYPRVFVAICTQRVEAKGL